MASIIKVDLHEVYNNSEGIEGMLKNAFEEAMDHKIKCIEIIHGKGSGQLKKRVLRFLQDKEMKNKYHRIDKDQKNFGRLFVYFKH